MISIRSILFVITLAIVLALFAAAAFTVQETEQVILTQFGRPVGKPITTAGIHFKMPFVQKVNVIEKLVMEWDGDASHIQTLDKLFINIDIYARWRIKDPLLYLQRLKNAETAQSRLDDFLDSETRNSVAKHPLIELIRTDKDRQPAVDKVLLSSGSPTVNWIPISIGREKIEKEVLDRVRLKLKQAELGLELLDIRFKRINYNEDVQRKIYDRMISERTQIADKFRSEGQGEAARIQGEKERELKKIESEAYRKIQEIKGKADAEATGIYAKAFNQSPAALDFYQFQKTMETYENTLDKSTMLLLSTSGDFFRFLKSSDLKAGDQATTATLAQP